MGYLRVRNTVASTKQDWCVGDLHGDLRLMDEKMPGRSKGARHGGVDLLRVNQLL